jgi:Inner membrane component of T3SS, cytoplasmic domain/zinc-ribbon domain
MDSRHVVAAQRFIECLNILRLEAGNPSLGHLEKLSDRRLLKSTLDDHLSGRRVHLPTWQLVAHYVSACRSAAASSGLDDGKLGNLQDWHAFYRAALEGNSDTPCPVRSQADDRDDLTGQGSIAGEQSETRNTTAMIEGIRCVICGSRNPLGARFCSRCGAGLEVTSRLIAESTDGFYLSVGYNKVERAAWLLPSTSAVLLVSGQDAGERFVLDQDVMTIGRDPASHVRLNDRSVSRRHSIVYRHGSQFAIKDVGSLNGTFVNQRRIEEASLEGGDVIHIGAVRLLFFQGKRMADSESYQ